MIESKNLKSNPKSIECTDLVNFLLYYRGLPSQYKNLLRLITKEFKKEYPFYLFTLPDEIAYLDTIKKIFQGGDYSTHKMHELLWHLKNAKTFFGPSYEKNFSPLYSSLHAHILSRLNTMHQNLEFLIPAHCLVNPPTASLKMLKT